MLSKLLSAAKGSSPARRRDNEATVPALPARHFVQQLHGLNADFLRLVSQVAGQSARWALNLQLPAEQHRDLSAATPDAMTRMAQSDFALFSASFAQPDVWLRLHDLSSRVSSEQRYASVAATDAGEQAQGNLFEAIVFFAWHLAQQDMNAARMLLGMADDSMQVIRRLEIWQCQWIARQHRQLLGIRWRMSSYFWSDLLRYGHSGDEQLMRIVRTLSTQLTAQELEPSAVARLSRSE